MWKWLSRVKTGDYAISFERDMQVMYAIIVDDRVPFCCAIVWMEKLQRCFKDCDAVGTKLQQTKEIGIKRFDVE